MTRLAIEENPSLQSLVKMASKEPVIITQSEKPAFVLMPLDADDLETWSLGENPDFLALMEQSWSRLRSEGGVPLAEARRRLLQDRKPARADRRK